MMWRGAKVMDDDLVCDMDVEHKRMRIWLNPLLHRNSNYAHMQVVQILTVIPVEHVYTSYVVRCWDEKLLAYTVLIINVYVVNGIFGSKVRTLGEVVTAAKDSGTKVHVTELEGQSKAVVIEHQNGNVMYCLSGAPRWMLPDNNQWLKV